MPRILLITGSHPRHYHFCRTAFKAFPNTHALIFDSGLLIPEIPDGLDDLDRSNFIYHFEKRRYFEFAKFGSEDLFAQYDAQVTHLSNIPLNSNHVVSFLEDYKPDVVLVFGVDVIRPPLLDVLPIRSINLHLGVCPYYRGCATLFWPFYMLEPQFAGFTYHMIEHSVDTGKIIHQGLPILSAGDQLQQVSANVVVQACMDLPDVVECLMTKNTDEFSVQKPSGKLWYSKDFLPQHLRLIYQVFDDKLVKMYLDGNLSSSLPKLISHL